MSPALQSVTFFALAGTTFLCLGSLLAAITGGAARRFLARAEPQTRHRALMLLAALPLVIAAALLLSASLPSLISIVRPELDHCLTHDDGHPHLCFRHLPHKHANATVVSSLVFLGSYLLVRALLSLAVMLRTLRRLRALAQTGVHRHDLGATVLEIAEPLCLTAGLVRPRVLISRGLLGMLDEGDRAVVLAHEREHVRRKDALTASFVRACSVLHLPIMARWLVRETQIAAEQVCDERAGARVGDRLVVAATLLKVERAAGAHEFGALAVGVNACALERRVEALLSAPREAGSLQAIYLTLAFGAVVSLLAADDVHHVTESLLSFVLR